MPPINLSDNRRRSVHLTLEAVKQPANLKMSLMGVAKPKFDVYGLRVWVVPGNVLHRIVSPPRL